MPGNGPKRFTRAQVAEHNTAEDAWIIVNRGVYDGQSRGRSTQRRRRAPADPPAARAAPAPDGAQ